MASCPSVAIDPDPDPDLTLPPAARLYREPSDLFFEVSALEALDGNTIDLALVDGLHLFEFALRDFMNLERWSSPSTVIVIDDIFPNAQAQAQFPRQTRVWCGDVWKLPRLLEISSSGSRAGCCRRGSLRRASRVEPRPGEPSPLGELQPCREDLS